MAEVREVEEGVTFPLGHQGDCHFLQRTLGGHFSRDHSGFRVQRRVGQVRLPSGTILRVRSPKALQANLLAWIVYAHPQLRSLATLPQAAAEGELAPWLARVFLEELQRALGTSGLLRQYRPQTAGESSIRGRIDFARLAHSQSNPARVPCRTFHRRDDTPLNRLFAAALQVIARHPELRTGGSATFRALQLCFDGITPAVPDRAIVIERLQQPFHLSHDLARLLVGRRGLGDGLELPGLAYLVDLEALFEKAVVRAFQEHVPGVRVKHNLIVASTAYAHRMQPDLYLPGRGIVDAKYKQSVSSQNLQQMVTYCWMTGCRHAVLVLPAHLAGGARYDLHSPDEAVTVHVVGMRIDGKDLASWKAAGEQLVRDCQAFLPVQNR